MGRIDPDCTGWHETDRLMERVMARQSERETESDKQTVSVRHSHMHIQNRAESTEKWGAFGPDWTDRNWNSGEGMGGVGREFLSCPVSELAHKLVKLEFSIHICHFWALHSQNRP